MDCHKMSKDEFDKYDERFGNLKPKIEEYLKDKDVDYCFQRNENTLAIEISIGMSIITVLPNQKWQGLKKQLRKVLMGKCSDGTYGKCSLCKSTLHKRVRCSCCSISWCVDCYISLFKDGHGVITCNKCNFKFGYFHDKEDLEMGILHIRRSVR